MESTPLTIDQLPAAVYQLNRKVDNLTDLVKAMSSHPVSDRWFDIEEVCEYLPDHPAITTVYGRVQRREMPFTRNGKRLIFRQSEIDAWLQSGRVKTATELDTVAEQRLSGKPRPKKGGSDA